MINSFKINKKLSFIIFVFSLICFIFFNISADFAYIIPICFFLIMTFGISHGSLDHLKGYKVLQFYKIKSKFIFYLIYIIFSLIIIFCWLALPFFMLILFLTVASYHFGKEDSAFGKMQKRKFKNFYFLLKGSIIVLAPILSNPEETIKIFEILDVQIEPFENNIILMLIGLSLMSNFFINKNVAVSLMDSFSVILLNLTFSPLIAFTIYFCFLHSIRHSISLIFELNSKNFTKGFKDFIKKALPLTLITAIIFLISVYFLTNFYILDEAILKVVFIGLASLTFPHILLEYIIEKNEK